MSISEFVCHVINNDREHNKVGKATQTLEILQASRRNLGYLSQYSD